MKFFKKIDDYLLHYYPSIWITRVHSFLPIGLGLVFIIYLVNMLVGWNPKETMPTSEVSVLIMIIPVLVYLVYWFIFQSRYNVTKSGGKMGYGAEYLNFFLYALVFTVAYFFILVVPYSNDMKMKYAVGYEEVKEDIRHLNEGNGIVNSYNTIEELGNNKYRIWETNFIYDYNDYAYETMVEDGDGAITLTRREVLQRIEKYVTAYNKYTRSTITKSSEEILSDCLAGEGVHDEYYYGYYDYEGTWQVENKISHIRDLHEGERYSMWGEPWFWRISFAFILWAALVVWIFKQMNLRHFVFGFISICLTPLLAALVGAILFGVIYRYSYGQTGEKVALNLVLFAYVIVAFFFIRGYLQDKLNQTSYVLSMYFHFWIPILPLFIYASVLARRRYDYYSYYYDHQYEVFGMKEEEFVYWICMLVGISSIAFFKPVYAKFRSLPFVK